jgi:hypothetical protein
VVIRAAPSSSLPDESAYRNAGRAIALLGKVDVPINKHHVWLTMLSSVRTAPEACRKADMTARHEQNQTGIETQAFQGS